MWILTLSRRLHSLFILAWLASPLQAELRLPALISEHMVLQRDKQVPIWGWANPGQEVEVRIANQTHKATAASDGAWLVQLDALPAGGPHTLVIQGETRLEIADVLVGEVWFGAGQSNMVMGLRLCTNAAAEIAAADYPTMRTFREASGPADTPQQLGSGEWLVCTPATAGQFSGTLYFFGREILRHLQVPVGLINASMGGTPIQSWLSAEAQANNPDLEGFAVEASSEYAGFDAEASMKVYEQEIERWEEHKERAEASGKQPRGKPSDPIEGHARRGNVGGLFNGKVAPLIPYGLRGILWYQGETNATQAWAKYYRYQLPLLVQDWRARFGQGDLPFAWVQLPNIGRPKLARPVLREGQRRALSLPNTGMAITIDVGDEREIHPPNKQDYGGRLALWALATVYGKDVPASGPLLSSYELGVGTARLTFAHTYGGLVARGGDLRWFEACDESGHWHPAQAKIEGNIVQLSAPSLGQLSAVRYAWDNNPNCNLFNQAGLPASPFTTGDY